MAFFMHRLSISLIWTLAFFGMPLGFYAQDSDWELRKDKNGIQVYTREVEGSNLDEFKGVGTVNASVESIVQILQDADNMKDWLPDCKESELLKLEQKDQYHYTITTAPWPVKNRDSYIHFEYPGT